MRPSVCLRLIVVAGILGGLCDSVARAEARGRNPLFAPAQPVVAARPLLQEEFDGYGLTVKDAQQHALEQASRCIVDNLHPGWTPPPEYLRHKNLVQFDEPQSRKFENAGPMKVVHARLQVTARQAEEMQDVGREQVRQQRQGLALRVLLGLVALLLVAGGYLRLEEATRGYHTGLLRAAAAGVLVLVGAGLWLWA